MPTVLDRLDQAWEEFISTPTLNASYPDALALAGHSSGWDHARTWVHQSDPQSADRVLSCLCRHAAAGDPAAAQIVMSLLMPGMVRLAGSFAGRNRDEVAQSVVAGMWEAIVTFPAERSTRCIAPQLLRKTRRSVLATPEITSLPLIRLESLPELEARESINAGEELLALLGDLVSQGSLTVDDARLIARWRIGGESTYDLARSLGRDQRTASYHRCRAEARLLAAA